MKKFIDLYGKVGTLKHDRVYGTLEWLDEHRDQAPGRTITVSEVEDEFARTWRMDINKDGYIDGFNAALRVTGTTVVAAPEPTNAEKLARSIDLNSRGVVYLTDDEILVLAEGMDEDGVKANG